MPPTTASPTGQNISFGPKRIEKRAEQTTIEKVGLIMLVGAVLLAAGVFAYRLFLQNKLTAIQTDIGSSEEVVEKAKYEELIAFDRNIRAARYLLANRVEISRVFTALESSVSKSVFYETLETQFDEAGSLNLTLSGVSPAFAKTVLQSTSLAKESLFSRVDIAGLEVRSTDDGDDTIFSVAAHIARDKLVSATTARTKQATTSPASSSATIGTSTTP